MRPAARAIAARLINQAQLTPEQEEALAREITQRVSVLPGVEGAGDAGELRRFFDAVPGIDGDSAACPHLDDGAEPVMLIGLIAGNYHRLALAKHLLAKGGREEVFRNISLPPFKRDAYIANLQRNDAAKIARGLQLTAAADLAIKTSQATPRLQLELLVCELAS